MSLEINWEALRGYLVGETVVRGVTTSILELLNRSDTFSASFDIERLRFGETPPSIEVLEVTDVDRARRWDMRFHEVNVPDLPPLSFDAPFEATVQIEAIDVLEIFCTVVLSLDAFAPGAIKYPVNAALTGLSLQGVFVITYNVDSLFIQARSLPELSFNLNVTLGAEPKLRDNEKVCGLLHQSFVQWIQTYLLAPNAIQIPLNSV